MNSIRHQLSGAFALTAAMLLVAPVSAQGSPDEPAVEPEPEERATDYYREARQAYGEGRYDRAAELLGQAWEADPNPIYRYNQILALQGAGDYEKALQLLDDHEQQLSEADDFEDIDEIRDELNEAIADRQRADESDALEDPEVAAPESDSNLAGWSLVGVGGASLATGVVMSTGVVIGDTIDRLETSANEGVDEVYAETDHDRDADLSRLKTHRWISAGLLIGGLAAGTTGTLMLRSGDDAGTTDDAAGSVELRPTVDNDFVGTMLEGRF